LSRIRRLFLLAFVVLLATGAGIWVWHETRPNPVVRGSAAKEFDTTPEAIADKAPSKIAWPTYGYNVARTHVAPAEYKLRPPFRVLWMMRARSYVEFPPSVAYGKVYVAQLRGRFFAVDGRTGRVVWQRSFAPYCTFASPTISHGLIYQTFLPPPCDYGPRGHPSFTAALRASNGKVVWYYRGPASESATLVHHGTLYFGSWDHHLYALDIRGKRPRLRWRFAADDELNSSPAYANGTISIGSNGGHVYAINARTGKQRWRAAAFSHFGTREYFYATPAIAYGRVYIGYTDGTVYSFGATSGHLLWTQHAGTYVYTAAAVWAKTVYVGSYDGNVYAMDAATGDIRWKTDLGASIHGAPTVMDGLIYFSTCGSCGHRGSRYAKMGPQRTFALDARTGVIRWRFFDGHYSPLVSDGTRVYLMGDTRLWGLAPIRRRKRG
jgi:outer membrane protein assembly factor BamB